MPGLQHQVRNKGGFAARGPHRALRQMRERLAGRAAVEEEPLRGRPTRPARHTGRPERRAPALKQTPGSIAGGWGPEVAEEEEEAQAPAFLHGYPQAAEERRRRRRTPAFLHGYPPGRADAGGRGSPRARPGFCQFRAGVRHGKYREQEPAAPEASSGKASWFGSFMRKNQKQAPAAQAGFSHPSRSPCPSLEPDS